MSSPIATRLRSKKQTKGAHETPSPLLALPNEVLAHIFTCLRVKDRAGLLSVNQRLHKLDRATGGRNFQVVDIDWHSGYQELSAGDYNTRGEIAGYSFDNLRARKTMLTGLLKNAHTDTIAIAGDLNAAAETILPTILKTTTFNKLDIHIFGHNTGKCVKSLLEGRNLKHADIELRFRTGVGKYTKQAHSLLLAVPTVNYFRLICGDRADEVLLDDAAFLHLVKNSNTTKFDLDESSITSRALYEAFQLCWTAREHKEATFHVPLQTMVDFYREHVDARFSRLVGRITHIDSDATLAWSKESAPESGPRMCHVRIQSRKVASWCRRPAVQGKAGAAVQPLRRSI
ncbi:hypothetical protein PFISCL1PPCAC_4580 [Pristionchus fissidentatus]|uniref:F-box domain-containing protein n=1 Tax=Pristionchus fissidentatus TaxID=1538716 RepID=A0AAV5V4K3_9BILA|nr:hypothetical protein PFISCL1PPCAC_4580 [Pristionchus fissidentatus]